MTRGAHGTTLYSVKKVIISPETVQAVVVAAGEVLRAHEPYHIAGVPYLRDVAEYWAVERRDAESNIIPRSFTGEVCVYGG